MELTKKIQPISRPIFIFFMALMITACATSGGNEGASCLNPKEDPEWVGIYANDEAYTIFQSISQDATAQVLANVKEYVAKRKDRKLITWDEFIRDIDTYTDKTMIIDEYAYGRDKTVRGMRELLRRYQGQGFALTWNTGIALTKNDYDYAEERYQLYRQLGDQYTVESKLSRVPIYPKWHLGPLVHQCRV